MTEDTAAKTGTGAPKAEIQPANNAIQNPAAGTQSASETAPVSSVDAGVPQRPARPNKPRKVNKSPIDAKGSTENAEPADGVARNRRAVATESRKGGKTRSGRGRAGATSARASAAADRMAASTDAHETQEAHDAERIFGSGLSGFDWPDGAMALQQKLHQCMTLNIALGFGYFQQMLASRDPVELLSIQQAFLRDSFATVSGQVRELSDLAGRVVSETMKPLQSGFSQTANPAAKAD